MVVVVDHDMYLKIYRIAEAKYCSASVVLRNLIADAPEPAVSKVG